MKTDWIYQFDSTEDGTIDWQYRPSIGEKIYHAHWMINKKNILIRTKLADAPKKRVLQELFESFAEENQSVRDHNNKKARERRAKKS